MKQLKLIMNILILTLSVSAKSAEHTIQHGFILSDNDTFGSHLVANGHHSRQVEVIGELIIQDANDAAIYQSRKENSNINKSYFLLQAQDLDLPNLTAGELLTGHIIESKTGSYEPNNIIVKTSVFKVHKVLLNISNPFFGDESKLFLSHQKNSPLNQDGNHLAEILNDFRRNKKHCCETGKKPCNWKC